MSDYFYPIDNSKDIGYTINMKIHTDYLENGVQFIYTDDDYDYQIRFWGKDGYHSVLWSRCGQNICVFTNETEIINEIKVFQCGISRFGSVKELHHWLYQKRGYKGEPH